MADDFRKLPRRHRNTTRTATREVFFELFRPGEPFDFGRAELLLRDRLRSVIGMILLSVALKLAIELIKYWLANRISEPSAIYELGEPGNFELNEEDHAD